MLSIPCGIYARIAKVHFQNLVKNWFRLVRGVAGRSLPLRLPVELRGGQETHLRLGHAQHQQPQRQHPQEVLPRSSGSNSYYIKS